RVAGARVQVDGLARDLGPRARLLAARGGEGGARSVARGFGVVKGGAGARGVFVLGRGVDHVEAAAVGRFAPLPADPQVGRNIGEEVFIHGTCPMNSWASRCRPREGGDPY